MEMECLKCNWQGDTSELVCGDEDAKSGKLTDEITFNICPQCGSSEYLEDMEEDED